MRKNWLSFAPLALALLLAPAPAPAQVTGSKMGYPDQCTNSETNPTTAEWLTCQQKRAGTTRANPLFVEPASDAFNVRNWTWNGTAWERWWSAAMNADNVAATTRAAWTGSFLMGWDAAGGNWDRLRLSPPGVSIATTTEALHSLGLTYFYDGTNYVRWAGSTAGADNVANATPSPWVKSFNMAYDGATWDRMTMTAAGDAIGATTPGLTALSLNTYYNISGTVYRRWAGENWDTSIANANGPAVLSLGTFYDNTTSTGYRWNGGSLTSSINAPVTGPYVGSVMYGYSSTGPMYYPVKADANGIFVHQADLLPGEDSTNDWRKVRLQSVATFAPTETTTASITDAGTTEVLASVEMLGYAGYTVNLKNTGGANNITNTYLYVSPNGTDWTLLDTNPTDITPGNTVRVFATTQYTDRYVKVLAAAVAGQTTSGKCWITARVAN